MRFALRPKPITVICETQKNAEGVPAQISSMEHYHLSLSEIMSNLNVSLDGVAVYLSSESMYTRKLSENSNVGQF